MKRLKSFFKKNFEKVNIQASLLTCALIVFSCTIIYLTTSMIIMSLLTDAYNERTDLTFQTIESHLDNRLYQPNIPSGAYFAALNYLSAVKDNMAISEIFIAKKNSNDEIAYVIDTKNEVFIDDEKITGNIEDKIREIYITNYVSKGKFFLTDDGCRYINFYPVSDDGKNIKGIVGIGIDAQGLNIYQMVLRGLVILIILICCLISIWFSKRIFRRISNPLYQDSSNTDTLTGLKNKNSFSLDFHNIEQNDQSRYGIVTIDLNGLKNVNDTRGHQTGDIFIQNSAKVIRSAINGRDYVAYRIGGDEFFIILKDCSIEEIWRLTEEIKDQTEEHNKKSGLRISMSIGYAKFDKEKDRNFSMTIERSDAMMYNNKRLYYSNKEKTDRTQ